MSTGTGIHTPASLRRSNRRLDPKRAGVQRAVSAMKAGGVLRLEHGRDRQWWTVSPHGWVVPEDVAAVLIARPDVVAVGDALFPNQSQTWRYLETKENEHD